MASNDSAVMTMNFELDGTSDKIIDLSQCASILNRRFYRQGLNWVVSGFRLGWNGIGGTTSATSGFSVAIDSAPQSWVVSGAWTKAMEKWRLQQNEALLESDSMDMKSRYADFKVHLDADHVSLGFSNNLLPVTPGGIQSPGTTQNTFLPGEWEDSKIVIPVDGGDTVQEWKLKLLGNDGASSKSCIVGYQQSRAVPQSPDPALPQDEGPRTSWMNDMFDDGNTNTLVTENATTTNDELPYDQDFYPYGERDSSGVVSQEALMHRQVTFTDTTIGAHQNMEGGLFPCGLIKVRFVGLPSPIVENFRLYLQVFLAPGNHKGYLCQNMREMN